MTKKVALIAGVSGIVGQNLARQLTKSAEWKIYGLSRNKLLIPGVESISVDLSNLAELKKAVSGLGVTHGFFAAWLRQETENKNIEVNGKLMQNFVDALADEPVEHVALTTGGKTYMGAFEDMGKFPVITPFKEEQKRLPGPNFYYAQEDILFKAASEQGFNWSVHRPSTIIGYALGNLMNMGVTLALYATICKETKRPFVFPGSATIYEGLYDITDARILARHLEWATECKAAKNQALNVTNGELFRWNWMWQVIADYFEVPVAPDSGTIQPLEAMMKDQASEWDKIVSKYSLKPSKLETLASWWHSDADLSRTFEPFYDMSKSRELGFTEFKSSKNSFIELFDQLRAERIIP